MKLDRDFFDNMSVRDLEKFKACNPLTPEEHCAVLEEIARQTEENREDAEKFVESPLFNLAYINLKKTRNLLDEVEPHDVGVGEIISEASRIVSVADKQGQGYLIKNFCEKGEFPVIDSVIRSNMEADERNRRNTMDDLDKMEFPK